MLDALRWEPSHPSHFTLEEACQEVEKLNTLPERVLFVGANHDIDHHEANQFLRKRFPSTVKAEYAFDGMVLDLQ